MTELSDYVRYQKPSGMVVSLYGNKIYIKEVDGMDFDVELLKAYYEDVLAKRERAIEDALADKETVANIRFEQEKARILEEVEAELIANAEEPYKHDIELCEKFLVVKEEEVADENEEIVEN